jgi:hypothetical protein
VLGHLVVLGMTVMTVFEIGSPFALFSRWFRNVWLAVLVPFHFSTLFTMDIFFWENVILSIVLWPSFPYLLVVRANRFTAGRSSPSPAS